MTNKTEKAKREYISAKTEYMHIVRGMDEFDMICISNNFYQARDEYHKAINDDIIEYTAQIETFRQMKKFSAVNACRREIARLEMLKANI